MKTIVIGIHGLGNKPPENILSSWWRQSILENVERWNIELKDLEFELVYWADILHPIPQNPDVSDFQSPLYVEDPYVPTLRKIQPSNLNLKRRIANFVEDKLSKILLNDDFTINYQSVTDNLIKRYFKDLEAYYADGLDEEDGEKEVKDRIRGRLIRVLEKHKGKRILLIAHSMGSIIAFDVLDMNPNVCVDQLITIGSPLGFPVVIGKIAAERSDKHTQSRTLQIPDNIRKSWYNLADLEDTVAFDFKLSDDFLVNSNGVKPIDIQVVNDYEYRRKRNPHKAYGYLRTKDFVQLIGEFIQDREKGILQQTFIALKNFLNRNKVRSIPETSSLEVENIPETETISLSPKIESVESSTSLNRPNAIDHLKKNDIKWDFVVIGGGATGMGVAVEAASRGYKTLLLEQDDFGKGTSSRSTKLIHGGVRYLQQGNISLVLEALRERAILRKNAPHLVHDLPFIVPNYDWWEGPFYGIGLRLYDMLAGKHGFGHSINLSPEETVEKIPQVETEGLRGGVQYHDGQFDDARLVINLAQTVVDEGATVINYMEVTELIKAEDLVTGVVVKDKLSDDEFKIETRCVINATGAFSDAVRKMDDSESTPIIKPSRGVHIVLDKEFLGGDTAIMVPHTDDGRVLFAIPWLGKVVIGTTDTEVESLDIEPLATSEEIDFIISNASRYLTRDPSLSDIKSVFAGLRPLVVRKSKENTAELSREHQILISSTGLVTVTGGKWTTYRLMGEETIDQAIAIAQVDYIPSQTKDLAIHGWDQNFPVFGALSHYGIDAFRIEEMIDESPKLGRYLHDQLPISKAMVVWAVREEMAQTVEDVLSRRTRCLLLDAKASAEIAEDVAKIIADELGKNRKWIKSQVLDYQQLVKKYLPQPDQKD
jgi:glycerol-3-phosphate dehydrogenase